MANILNPYQNWQAGLSNSIKKAPTEVTRPPVFGARALTTSSFGVPTLKNQRFTWSETSGYNTQEVYTGDFRQLVRAFDDPVYVCGAQQVVLEKDPESEAGRLSVDFGHRTRREAQLNYSQPENFKDVWVLESQVENVEVWRAPKFASLSDNQFVSNGRFPLGQLIVFATQQYLAAFNQAIAVQINETIGRIETTPPEGHPGQLNLVKAFDIKDYVDLSDANETQVALAECLADSVLKGKTTHPQFRQVVTNQSVVPSNSFFSNSLFDWRRGYISTLQLCWTIRANIFGLEAQRARTPAACRPISASKWSMIRGLLSRFGDVHWLPYAPTITELNNGSFEISRSWVEFFDWEVEECTIPENTEAKSDPITPTGQVPRDVFVETPTLL